MPADDKSEKRGHGQPETLAELWEAELRAKERLELIRHKLLVMSGKGGVGKSTVSVYLGLGLARRGYRVGLLDVDLPARTSPACWVWQAGSIWGRRGAYNPKPPGTIWKFFPSKDFCLTGMPRSSGGGP